MAAKIAKEMLENSTDMQRFMLFEILEALENGEDVDDNLSNMILTKPFMSKLIDELLKYEKE